MNSPRIRGEGPTTALFLLENVKKITLNQQCAFQGNIAQNK